MDDGCPKEATTTKHTDEGLDVLPTFCSSTVKRMFVAESTVCGFMFTRQCRVDYIEAWNSVVTNN